MTYSRPVVARAWGSLGVGGKNKGYMKKGIRHIRVMEIFLTLFVVMVIQLLSKLIKLYH